MQSERLISRRDVLKAGALLGTAFALEACGINKSSPNNPGGTNEASTQNPTESEKPLPNQALERVLDVFLTSMTPQKGAWIENGVDAKYFSSTSNVDTWKNENPGVLDNAISQVTLKSSFISADITGETTAQGYKTAEEIELNNLLLTVEKDYERTLTAADKANGIEWKGLIDLTFLKRYRTTYTKIGEGMNSQRQAVEQFVETPEANFPDFSSWLNGMLQFNVSKVNGLWQIDVPTLKGDFQKPNMADLFENTTCQGTVPNCVTINFANP